MDGVPPLISGSMGGGSVSWRRLRPGEDAIVDAFMRGRIEQLHQRLEAANRWRSDGRQYRLDPPLPRGLAAPAFEVADVVLAPAGSGSPSRRTMLALAIFALSYAIVAIPDLWHAAARLLRILPMG